MYDRQDLWARLEIAPDRLSSFPYSRYGPNLLNSENAPWVLVAGSALEFGGRGLMDTKDLHIMAEELGRGLANIGAVLVTGACPGLPDTVASSFSKISTRQASIGLSAYKSPWEHQSPKPFAHEGFPCHADVIVWTGLGFEHLNVLTAGLADAVIVIGGGLGTMLESGAAVENEIPVFTIVTSGGMSSRIDSYFKDFAASFKNYSVHECSSVSEALDSILRLSPTEARRRKRRSWARLLAEQPAPRLNVNIDIQEIEGFVDLSVLNYSARYIANIQLIDFDMISHMTQMPILWQNAFDFGRRNYNTWGTTTSFDSCWREVVWGPSIDSIAILSAIKKHANSIRIRSIADIGSGSGYLANVLSNMYTPDITICIEPDETSAAITRLNLTTQNTDCNFEIQKKTIEFAEMNDVDLIVANLPYILPIHDYSNTISQFAGTSGLSSLISRLPTILNKTGLAYIICSSAALNSQPIVKSINNISKYLHFNIIEKRHVRFKIDHIASDSMWMKSLFEIGAIYYDTGREFHSIRPGWMHELSIVEIKHK